MHIHHWRANIPLLSFDVKRIEIYGDREFDGKLEGGRERVDLSHTGWGLSRKTTTTRKTETKNWMDYTNCARRERLGLSVYIYTECESSRPSTWAQSYRRGEGEEGRKKGRRSPQSGTRIFESAQSKVGHGHSPVYARVCETNERTRRPRAAYRKRLLIPARVVTKNPTNVSTTSLT